MTTLSVPILPKHEKFIKKLVLSGKAANKAHAVRQALEWYEEEEILKNILLSEEDIKRGKVFRGDLKKILNNFND